MKTIILGYPDISGKEKAVLVAGTEVPITEQVQIVTGIKASEKFPKGIVRVEWCEVVSRNIGIHSETANEASKADKAGEVKRVEALKKADPSHQRQSAIIVAKENLSKAAIARNELVGLQTSANAALARAKAAVIADGTKENKQAVMDCQAEIAENEKRLEAANKKVAVIEAELKNLTKQKK